MRLDQFLELIKKSSPYDLAAECVHKKSVHAIPEEEKYDTYRAKIKADYPSSSHISIMGSGNWGFSLNPNKNYSLFNEYSDIDIAIVCRESFEKIWEELRSYHRENYYLLNRQFKDRLKRNGENVYAGFISPKWIPNKTSSSRFQYEINTNKYADQDVGYREVNMMFFKNLDEVIDYYVRGFAQAKSK